MTPLVEQGERRRRPPRCPEPLRSWRCIHFCRLCIRTCVGWSPGYRDVDPSLYLLEEEVFAPDHHFVSSRRDRLGGIDLDTVVVIEMVPLTYRGIDWLKLNPLRTPPLNSPTLPEGRGALVQ